jgi:hypothetical protein
MGGAFRCHCALCVRTVRSAQYVCNQCVTDAKAVSHVLAAAREHVPELRRAPDPVVASRMWRRLAPELGKALAEDLVKRYHSAWQLELGGKANPDWLR